LFPAVLSIAGKRVNLDVESHIIPALAWTCIVGESGTGKSRAENLILAPLKQQQIEERKRWEAEMREYQQLLKQKDKDAPEPPRPSPERKYLFEVATIQALMKRLSEQGENGSIWARDELAGLFKSLGQFSSNKGGESEGLECLLKMWDGSSAFVERMDAFINSYVADETRLSIAGGIQPGAFRQAFKDPDDPQGLQARFLYAVPQIHPAKRVKGYCILSEILPALYDWLDQLPIGSIKLSWEADVRYSQLVEEFGAEAEKSSNPAIRAWMRKLSTQLLRIALGTHLLECFFDRSRNLWQVQPDTLERAVEVCRYYRSAFQVVQEKAADSDNVSSILLKIWDLAAVQPDGVSPRDIYRQIKALGRRAVAVGRDVAAYTLDLLSKLQDMGKGKLEKNGRYYRFFAIFNPPPTPDSPQNPDHPHSPQNPDHPPTPDSPQNPDHSPTPGGNGSGGGNSVAEGIRQEAEGNLTNGVTVVTAAKIETGQELEASLTPVVSPVTEEIYNSCKSEFDFVECNSEVDFAQAENLVVSPVKEENANYSENLTWLLQFLADLESTPPSTRFISCEQLDDLLDECEINFRVVQETKGCLDALQQVCPDYLERVFMSLALVDEALSKVQTESEAMPTPIVAQPSVVQPKVHRSSVEKPSVVQPSVVQPSVEKPNEASLSPTRAELQALLLACQSLTELKSLKKQHGDQINSAYRQLPSSQQLKVDGIAAMAVPGEVYKYTGPTLSQDGQKLTTGVLVYIDPNAPVRKSLLSVPVWLLRGLELGWHTAMSVSRDCLLLVEKAVSDVVDFNIEQPPLFDIF
jgi:hypothetical protein